MLLTHESRLLGLLREQFEAFAGLGFGGVNSVPIFVNRDVLALATLAVPRFGARCHEKTHQLKSCEKPKSEPKGDRSSRRVRPHKA